MDDRAADVERVEQGDAWGESDEVVTVETRQSLDKVIPIRLSSEHWDALRREANELGMGPSTLARMWLIERLRDGAARRKVS
jgi:hypothetical protein